MELINISFSKVRSFIARFMVRFSQSIEKETFLGYWIVDSSYILQVLNLVYLLKSIFIPGCCHQSFNMKSDYIVYRLSITA